jgi:CubicO group peptidase (beta-lactamase class C family)
MADPQATIQALLDDLVASGEERGLQVAVYHRGDLVVDAWAGMADAATDTSVTPDTLFTVYSVSKGITATAIHILAEQGKLAYDDPIAKHWPEFATSGKAGTLVRHALSHLAGVPQLPPGTTGDDVLDWSAMCDRIAALTPLWPPGETLCYHALTYGWILGGLAERADGRPFARIVEEEIAQPLNLNGLYFGVPACELDRVATLEELPVLRDAEPGAIPDVAPPGSISDAQMNRPEIRQACLPAYGLCTTARSLARVYASLIGDGVDQVRLLPSDRVRRATTLEVDGLDASDGSPSRFALGYGLGGPDSSMGPRPSAFGHGGYGGAYGYADPDFGLAVGLTKNRLVVDELGIDATRRILHAVRASLGVPH